MKIVVKAQQDQLDDVQRMNAHPADPVELCNAANPGCYDVKFGLLRVSTSGNGTQVRVLYV